MRGHHAGQATDLSRVAGGDLGNKSGHPVGLPDGNRRVLADVVEPVLVVDIAEDQLHRDVLGPQSTEPDIDGRTQDGAGLELPDDTDVEADDLSGVPVAADPFLPLRQVGGDVVIFPSGEGLRGRGVIVSDIVTNQAGGEDLRSELGDAIAHHLQPFSGVAVRIKGVEAGNDLILDD